MTTQAGFTSDEWTQLRIVPSLVAGGMRVSDAEQSFLNEMKAALQLG